MLSIRRMLIRWWRYRAASNKIDTRLKNLYLYKLLAEEKQVNIPVSIDSGFETFQSFVDYCNYFIELMENEETPKRKFNYDQYQMYRDQYFSKHKYASVPTTLANLYVKTYKHLPKEMSLTGYSREAGLAATRIRNEFNNFLNMFEVEHELTANHRGER